MMVFLARVSDPCSLPCVQGLWLRVPISANTEDTSSVRVPPSIPARHSTAVELLTAYPSFAEPS